MCGVQESKLSHSAESGVVARGARAFVSIYRSAITFNQVHGGVAEEGACLRVFDCKLRNNKTSACSGCDPSSCLTLTRSIATQSGKGVLIVSGASGQALECSLEFNEEAAVTVQDPGLLNDKASDMCRRWGIAFLLCAAR